MEAFPSMDAYLAQAPAPSLSGQPPHSMSEREIEALDAEALARKEEALRRMNAALDAEMPDLAEVDAVIARAARDEAILAAPKCDAESGLLGGLVSSSPSSAGCEP